MVARTPESLRRQYELECRLADRLRTIPPADRPRAYAETYDALYTGLREAGELHPERPRGDLEYSVAVVKSLVPHPSSILEVGSGTGHVALALAALGHDVVATELSDVPLAVLRQRAAGTAIRVIKTNALTLHAPGAYDVVWSNDLVEHLHPDDTALHLRAVLSHLKPGGRYILVTPNRYAGPFDISRGFDRVARGLHLKEWTHRELEAALLQAGFARVETIASGTHLRWKLQRRLGWLASRYPVTLRVGGTALKRWIERLLDVPVLGKVASALGATPVTLIATAPPHPPE